MQTLPSHDELDALVDELYPELAGKRSGDDFLFDPESLTESTRFYYVDFLKWLGIDESVLPPERICVHADRKAPANLEPQRGGGEGYSLYLDIKLYRSLAGVKLALAHQFTHLRLVIDEKQTMAEVQNCRPLSIGDDEAEKPKAKGSKRKSKSEAEDDEAKAEEADEKNAETEIRTEVAAFVLGFGKLMLNGACEWDQLEVRDDSLPRVTTLPVESLAYLYKKVADRADVDSKELESGLSDEAKDALGTAKKK